MKRILLLLVAVLLGTVAYCKEYKVYGPQGGLAMDLTLPDGFDVSRDHCPMVILMHGIFSSKDFLPMPQLAKALAKEGKSPAALVLLAPGAVIKEACQGGTFFGNRFDPSDPPEHIRCFGLFRLGREYMLSSQKLEIYETAAAYHGPVCIVHGDNDNTVPLWCSERYVEIYHDPEFHLVEGENHRFSKRTGEMVGLVTGFLSTLP